jgi:hypothetical protein
MEPIFPGMDPYLEAPEIWPDFHDAFLSYVREALQPVLPDASFAQLRSREEVGIGGHEGQAAVVYSDVAVKDRQQPSRAGGASSSVALEAATVPEQLVVPGLERLEVNFVEIRETGAGGRLVTLIEMLSPSNKLRGPDREAFEKKLAETLASDTHWVEIALLRRGDRLGCHPRVGDFCKAKGYDYAVVVSHASQRRPRLRLDVYGFTVRQRLPKIKVPLREPDPPVVLDLGHVFRRAYETGPYPKVIRYSEPPRPGLDDRDAAWAQALVSDRLAAAGPRGERG